MQAAREERFYVPLDDGRELMPKYVVCQFDGGFTLIGEQEAPAIRLGLGYMLASSDPLKRLTMRKSCRPKDRKFSL